MSIKAKLRYPQEIFNNGLDKWKNQVSREIRYA